MKTFSSWQMSGILIGGIEILWAISIEYLKSSIGITLDYYGMGGVFFGLMLGSGVLCVLGSLIKCRRFRMWGLAMTPFIMFPCAITMYAEGVINTASITMPWLGLMGMVIFMRDSTRKTRDEPVAR